MLYNLFENRDFVSVFAVALLAEGVDRNSEYNGLNMTELRSPSSQRAWIEIPCSVATSTYRCVALLAEGVDRNRKMSERSCFIWVALLAEGVDRNSFKAMVEADRRRSPSSQRAWIEITTPRRSRSPPRVALLAEGVDRNSEVDDSEIADSESPSSQRAWIEIR